MLKQLEIFNKLVLELKKDIAVEGVLLNGSVAVGTATDKSDFSVGFYEIIYKKLLNGI